MTDQRGDKRREEMERDAEILASEPNLGTLAYASSARVDIDANAEMLEGYAESYMRMGREARVLAHDVAWDIRHNMIPALRSAPSARAPIDEAVKECQIVLEDVKYGKDRPWRDGAVYAAERCLRRILNLRVVDSRRDK